MYIVPSRLSTMMSSTFLRRGTSIFSFRKMMSTKPHISVTPPHCLNDEEVVVRVTGLSAGEPYTLASFVTDHKDVPFNAVAQFHADQDGTIDLSRDASFGGHYRGVFPMGLFNNISPYRSKVKHHRFVYKNVQDPLKFKLCVYENEVALPINLFGADHMMLTPDAEVSHDRYLMGSNCRREVVRHGKVRGVLHLPPGPGPHPGVVDLFGIAGGMLEHRAAMLASRGIAALALPFFAYEDLPKTLNRLEMSYFEEAVQYLLSREEINSSGVGVMSVSKGSDLALNMSLHIPEVKAVVAINSIMSNLLSDLVLKDGSVIPGFQIDEGKIIIHKDSSVFLLNTIDHFEDHPESIIPVEKISAHVLWMASLEDTNAKSEFFADYALEKRKHLPKDLQDRFQVKKFAGAGHLLEPPYTPFCHTTYNRVMRTGIIMGGKPLQHCHAQVEAWKETLNFFKKHLF